MLGLNAAVENHMRKHQKKTDRGYDELLNFVRFHDSPVFGNRALDH